VREIPLKGGQTALVDDEDYEPLSQYRWQAHQSNSDVYAARTSEVGGKRRTVWMHRLIMGAPPDKRVDHLNHNTLDNRRSNLRVVSGRENSYNRRKLKRSTSVYKGVYKRIGDSEWRAELRGGSPPKHYYLGSFPSEEQAARAYDEKAREVYGEHAALNFPEPGERAALPPEGTPVPFREYSSLRLTLACSQDVL
jgi:hypothetical protein